MRTLRPLGFLSGSAYEILCFSDAPGKACLPILGSRSICFSDEINVECFSPEIGIEQ